MPNRTGILWMSEAVIWYLAVNSHLEKYRSSAKPRMVLFLKIYLLDLVYDS